MNTGLCPVYPFAGHSNEMDLLSISTKYLLLEHNIYDPSKQNKGISNTLWYTNYWIVYVKAHNNDIYNKIVYVLWLFIPVLVFDFANILSKN